MVYLYLQGKEEEVAAKDARFEEEKHISIDKANEEAKPFLDALKREPTSVIERVASAAYAMLKEREQFGNIVTKNLLNSSPADTITIMYKR